ncbi:MAG: SusC/RagA family TonB-linked outer membrane protein [Chitinophagaceae bacterium]|nr:SusC/RagA family TonB-linked outer membrane protein [Chitinophagaceae bacterium]
MKSSLRQVQRTISYGLYCPVKKILSFAFPVFLAMLFSLPVLAQNNIRVKGRVTGENGQAIAKASIIVKGTSNGTTADDNGNYEITAPSNGTLVISAVNFATQEVSINNRQTADITLVTQEKTESEVIVVGYGTQSKRNVTGSIASVNLETMGNAPNTNIGQYLQGTVPGLNVGLSTFAGGTPPINIRGRVTINGSQTAVIIVDGIQYSSSLSSINPDDIASIDILKDASATAVYGAQGANGVILITTKKGKFNQKPKISFSTAYTSQKPSVGDDLKPKNRQQYLDGVRDAFWQESYIGPDYTQLNPAFDVRTKIDPTARPGYDNGRDFNWYEEATNTGAIFENNLSVSGGGDRVTYLLSGGFVNQKGWIINDKFNRKNLRANLEIKALEWWKVGLQAYGSFVDQDGAEPGFGGINIFSPLYSPYDSLGNVIPSPTNTVLGNPMTSYFVDDRDRHQYYTGVLYTDIDIPGIKGLHYRMNFGQNLRNDQHFYASRFDANLNGRAYKENQSLYDYTFDNILTYKTRFKQHGLELTALYGAIERKYERTFAEGTGFSRLNLSYNGIGGADQRNITTNAYSEALNYQMGKLNYSYDDKYLLQAIVRRDGFSGFAENFKYGVFPSVSAGWVISSEDFMKNIRLVDYLKLRAGYGVIGNQTQRYYSIATVNTNSSYVFGDNATVLFGQQVASLGNANLKWERTKGIDIGIDFAILNDRLTGNFDYYNNKTTDLLFNVQIPDVTGFTTFRTNLGEINNKGWEIGLTGKIIRNKDFSWTSSFNIWRNTNKIIHLTGVDANGDGIEDDLVASNLFIGRPVGANTIFNYLSGPIYQLGETPLPGFFVGSRSVVDVDKSGTITAADRVFIGSKLPAYSMSLYNSVSYKGITFSFMLNSVQGGKNGYLENNARQYFRDDNGIRNNELRGVEFWTPANPDAKYPRITGGTRPLIDNPPLYESRSFVRLQDASISYTLPKNILDKIKAQAINIYVSGKNLITWTKWEGWDPEALVPIFANGVTTDEPNGMRTDGRPVLRAITIGAHITF